MEGFQNLTTRILRMLETELGFADAYDVNDNVFNINLSLTEGGVKEVDLVIKVDEEAEELRFISGAHILADVNDDNMLMQLSYFFSFAELMCPGGNFSVRPSDGLIYYTLCHNIVDYEKKLRKGIDFTKAVFERFGVGLISIVYGAFSCDEAIEECRTKWYSRNRKSWIKSLIDFTEMQEEEMDYVSKLPSYEDISPSEDALFSLFDELFTSEDDLFPIVDDMNTSEDYMSLFFEDEDSDLDPTDFAFNAAMEMGLYEIPIEQGDKKYSFSHDNLRAIITYLSLNDFCFDTKEKGRRITFYIETNRLSRRWYNVEIVLHESQYIVYYTLPIAANLENEEQVRRLLEFFCRVNEREYWVNFVLQMDSGKLLAMVNVDCTGVNPTYRLLHRSLITEPVKLIDHYTSGIWEILFADSSADEAYAKCIN